MLNQIARFGELYLCFRALGSRTVILGVVHGWYVESRPTRSAWIYIYIEVNFFLMFLIFQIFCVRVVVHLNIIIDCNYYFHAYLPFYSIYDYVPIQVSINLCIQVSICLCMYICIYLSMYVYMYLSVYVCMYVSICLCMYVCIYPSIS